MHSHSPTRLRGGFQSAKVKVVKKINSKIHKKIPAYFTMQGFRGLNIKVIYTWINKLYELAHQEQ
jgi:hypothetical protein